MKVLYLHQHFATRAGSAGTRSYEFARLLTQFGHEVTVICGSSLRSGLPEQHRHLVSRHDIEGVRILQLNVPYSQKMGFIKRILAFMWFMVFSTWMAIRQREVDIIYATSAPLTIAVPALVTSLIRRRPYVFEVRDLWPSVPIGLGVLRNSLLVFLARQLERLAYRRARHVVVLSPGMKEGVLAQGVSPAKITVIPNASDNELFDIPPARGKAFREQYAIPDGPLVVYTGAFGKVNEITYLVRLANEISARGEPVSFLLMGAGKEKETVVQLSEELGLLGNTVRVMDTIPRQEIPAVLAAATIATSTVMDNPVLWHNSANKFFDALAAGKPIAINHRGWQADLLESTGAGLVLDATDMNKAAEKLLTAIQDSDWLCHAEQAAKTLAREQFDRTMLARRLERLLQGIVAES